LALFFFSNRWIRLTGNCKPALLERDTPFFAGAPAAFPVFDFPLAFPPAMIFFPTVSKCWWGKEEEAKKPRVAPYLIKKTRINARQQTRRVDGQRVMGPKQGQT
jgi:hypothetical protein